MRKTNLIYYKPTASEQSVYYNRSLHHVIDWIHVEQYSNQKLRYPRTIRSMNTHSTTDPHYLIYIYEKS